MSVRLVMCITVLMLHVLITGCRSEQTPAAKANRPASSITATWQGFTPAQTARIRQMAARTLPDALDDSNEASANLEAAKLGHVLFFDEALSSSHTISCATCHQPDHGFSLGASLGMGKEATARHPPTLLNVAHQRWFDWDGKADSLWSQAARPLESPLEHATTRTHIARHVLLTPELRAMYARAFPDTPLPDIELVRAWPEDAMPGEEASASQREKWHALGEDERAAIDLVFTRVLKAIGSYEAKLTRVDARFDRWVAWSDTPRAERDAQSPMSEEEVRGLQLFVGEARCITCHNGPLFSDLDFHNLGLGERPWLDGGVVDRGRADGARSVKNNPLNAHGVHSASPDGERAKWTKYLMATPENLGQFKTPTLRNVALTPPYMHGGHFETLEEVVRFYVTLDEDVQTGHREDALRPVNLTPSQQRELVAFLRALTGDEPSGARAMWFSPPKDK